MSLLGLSTRNGATRGRTMAVWASSAAAFAVALAFLAAPPAVSAGKAAAGKNAPPEKKAEDENNSPRRIGQFIRIPTPISGPTFDRTRQMVRRVIERAKKENARLTLVFDFDVPKEQKDFGRHSEFDAAHALANFLSGDELNAVRTVAFVPRPIQGHAVLPIAACQEIIMAPDALIGAAGIDEKTISVTMRSAYAEIAGRRRTVPTALAIGMLDPAVEVLQVETDAGREFILPGELASLKKRRVVQEPTVVKRAGQPGEFTGDEARRLGIVAYLASDRRAVLDALELPATAIEDDPSLAAGWRAVRIDLKGPIRAGVVDQAQRMIEEQIRRNNVNFVCLWIDSPGGSVADAMRLANFLALELDPGRVRTVAYVPGEARSDAALIALACDQLVIHPNAVLGGPGASEPSEAEIDDARRVIRERWTPRTGRSWSIPVAMIDSNLNVYCDSRPGETGYFCDEELAEQAAPGQWTKGPPITTPGRSLQFDGLQAEQYRLANYVVEGFSQFKRCYGLENNVELIEPGWADFLIRAMASPGVAVLLLVIGFASLYIELQSPGIGIGGFAAAICFLLFFWSKYLGGSEVGLEILLFLAGVVCLLLEIFVVPGFGIFGLGGGAMILASIVLASQTSNVIIPHNDYQREQLLASLLTIAAAVVGFIVLLVLLRKRLPRSRLVGPLLLEPPTHDEAETIRRREALVDRSKLLGARGTTTTQLTPGGKARFGDLLVDVMADGEVVDRGATVEVVEVHGARVLVREARTMD